MGDVPEQVYREAAVAYCAEHFGSEADGLIGQVVRYPPFRAAVESAYWAGQVQGARDIVAQYERLLTDTPKPPPDTSWLQTPGVQDR